MASGAAKAPPTNAETKDEPMGQAVINKAGQKYILQLFKPGISKPQESYMFKPEAKIHKDLSLLFGGGPVKDATYDGVVMGCSFKYKDEEYFVLGQTPFEKPPFVAATPTPAATVETPVIQGALPQEAIEKLENSVCLFVEDGKAFGCGFAFSTDHVYTAAHHWTNLTPAATEGTEVDCFYGKLKNRSQYKLEIVRLDEKLDYCLLKRVGDAPFSEWLDLNPSANLYPTVPVFLAAFQIGLNKDLASFDLTKSLGTTQGIVVKVSDRHFLHSCPSYKGDSGGALVISNAQVVGIHIESVNEVEELVNMASVDLGSVAASINQLTESNHGGSVALKLSAIPEWRDFQR